MRILMVCTGNLCRSPMAEALMRDALQRRGCPDVEVVSAGTWAGYGHGATVEACSVLADRGIDLTSHRSHPLTADDVEAADLVVAMTSVHLREIDELVPGSTSKVRLLKELAAIQPEPSSTHASLDGLLAGRRPDWVRALDLDDPIGLPRFSYERCADEIAAAVDHLVAIVCPD